jgi:hypothetical protein
LFIGRNDCGKTTALEASWWASSLQLSSAPALLTMQQWRQPGGTPTDFQRGIAPMFRNADAVRGASIRVQRTDGMTASAWMGLSQGPISVAPGVDAATAWSLDIRTTIGTEHTEEKLSWNGAQFILPPGRDEPRAVGIQPYANVTTADVKSFSQLKSDQRVEEVLECVRLADETITEIDLLSPDGKGAELWVRKHDGPMLPLYTLGQGVIRIIEIAMSIVANFDPFIDEFENGIHHSVFYDFWVKLIKLSAGREQQLFASTHSEECIQAACRAFTDSGDDGLRVIRLDRSNGATRASVYDRDTAAAAERLGVELRG